MNTRSFDIPQSEHSKPLDLAGDIRQKRRNLNALRRALRRYEKECLRRAHVAGSAARRLDDLDVGVIAVGKFSDRKLLASLLNLDCGVCGPEEVGRALRSLIGAENDWIADQILRRKRTACEARTLSVNIHKELDALCVPNATKETSGADEANKSFSAAAVLADAARIVAAASDADLDEIDWTENPKTERERALRSAIIRRVELESSKIGSWRTDGTSSSAMHVLWALENLAPTDASQIGSDLYDAIERWEIAKDEEDKRNMKITKRRLLDQARRDIDGEA